MDNIKSGYSVIIGERLRQIRISKNLTQEDVSKLTGINRQNICRIEKGTCNTKIDTIYVICKALGVDIIIK